MKKTKVKKKVGRGFVIRACNNVGLKTATAYYKALNNIEKGIPLSIDQKAVMKEFERITTE